MRGAIKLGERLPPVHLARLAFGHVEAVSLDLMLAARRAVIVGVPGAFSPVCSRHHLPEFVSEAPRLRQSGVDLIICVAPNDPWALDAWASQLDPQGAVQFLSDGNLELARHLGVLIDARSVFMGQRPARYLIVTRNAVLEHFKVEADPSALTCTRAQDVLLPA